MAGGKAGGTERLIAKIKAAYWLALMIIVAMVLAAYVMLQSMMGEHRRYEEVIALIGSQKALSQRIVFLANAATMRAPERTGPMVGLLRDATREFETNNGWLAEWVDSVDSPRSRKSSTRSLSTLNSSR